MSPYAELATLTQRGCCRQPAASDNSTQLFPSRLASSLRKMVAKQRIRMANEKHSKNITQRGNVAKTLVSLNNDGSVNTAGWWWW